MTERQPWWHLTGALLCVLLVTACASSPAPVRPAAVARLESYERLGLESIEQDRWDRAWEYFTLAQNWARSLELRDAEARTQLNLAWIEERSGQLEQARQRLQPLAADIWPAEARAEACLRLARLEADAGRLEAGRAWLQQAQALVGADAPRRNSMQIEAARQDLLAGRLDAAQAQLQQVLERKPGSADEALAQRLLAQLLLQRQHTQAALERLQQAWVLDHAAGRSTRLVLNLQLQAEARASDPQQARLLRERAQTVCAAWLARFDRNARWRPRQCPGPVAPASAQPPVAS